MYIYIYTCVYVSTPMLTPGHVRVHTHLFFPLLPLHAPLGVIKRRSVTLLRSLPTAEQGPFLCLAHSPTSFSGRYFGPSLLRFSVSCSLRFYLHTGISRMSRLHFSFVCIWFLFLRATYADVLSVRVLPP